MPGASKWILRWSGINEVRNWGVFVQKKPKSVTSAFIVLLCASKRTSLVSSDHFQEERQHAFPDNLIGRQPEVLSKVVGYHATGQH